MSIPSVETLQAENTRLHDEILTLKGQWEQRVRELSALNAIAATVNRSLDLRTMLQDTLTKVLEVMGVEIGVIYLLEADEKMLRLWAHTGVAEDFVREVERLAIGEGLTGRAVATGRPIVVADIANDPRLTRMVVRREGLRAFVCVPIQANQRTLGAMSLLSYAHRQFSEQDVALLVAIGQQIGVATENAHLYRQTKHDLRQLQTLRSLVETISSELDLKILLQKIVKSAVELLGADFGALGLVDEARGCVRHQALYNMPDEMLGFEFGPNVGLTGHVWAKKEPVVLRRYAEEIPLPAPSEFLQNILAALSVPIWWQEQVIGVFSIGTHKPERLFHDRDVDVLSLFAKHTAIAIENTRLVAESNRLAHVEERNRIARELHDSVTQSLFTVVMMADAVRNFLRTDPAEAERTAELLYRQAHSALSEMRALIYELRPTALQQEGLVTALRKLATSVKSRHGLEVKVRTYGTCRLPVPQEEALYRIAQEALNNVIKHAGARRVLIEVRILANSVRLTVSDDGIGLPEALPSPDDTLPRENVGLGLSTMRERAEQLGGRFLIAGVRNAGTTVEVRLPRTVA